ncbi:DUF6182 family protein [Sphaerisporangium sp. TRM90804]|uniref:DUF6182 family protein n=1 Tax=Sphaerisporangium sp. TRM90804 TaxID=3031113 RepID=UPI00244AA433|nr:DUF6182 family protein [Sphaerisporangium sp. TRM90804]MDH2429624.1 DUF6182 family protein [Sphaerisporangium sp. TRM90804]
MTAAILPRSDPDARGRNRPPDRQERQALLRDLYDERVDACTGGLPAVRDLSVIVVLATLDPAAFAKGALKFALGLRPARAEDWMRAYTRTAFLAGNPANLGARFGFDHLTPDGHAAWTAPADPGEHVGLRRLLRAFSGTAPLELPARVDLDVPGASPTGAAHDLYVVTSGTVGTYLVHLHHTLAEAALRGILRPGDRLRLRHVRDLGGMGGRPAYARVLPVPAAPGRLRPVTWLTAEDAVPGPRPDFSHHLRHARKGRAA